MKAAANSLHFCDPISVSVMEQFQKDVVAKTNKKFSHLPFFIMADMSKTTN